MYTPVVTIAAIGDSVEGHFLRSLLERMGQQVRLVPLDNPDDLCELLHQGAHLPRVLIISGRGDSQGFIFGSDGQSGSGLLVDDSIGPAYLQGKIALNGQLVISTANLSGSRAMAEAFVDGGAGAYLAPEGSPTKAESALFLHVILHEHVMHKTDLEPAMITAHHYADAFTLYLP